MKFLTRRLRPDDFEACWQRLAHRSRYSAQEQERIKQAWAVLLPEEAMRGMVIFDADGDGRGFDGFGDHHGFLHCEEGSYRVYVWPVAETHDPGQTPNF